MSLSALATAALLLSATALAACAPSSPGSHPIAGVDCTESSLGSRLCDSNGAPESGNGYHDPSIGMSMPTHPGGP